MESAISKIVFALGAILFSLFAYVAIKKGKSNDMTIAGLVFVATIMAMFILWEFLHPVLQLLTIIYMIASIATFMIWSNNTDKRK
ncbi:MAG: hypothetical protein MJ245_03430 [Clostridia bacterium]|nr:hypothetical protein [Clostridia bacterium]